MPWFTRSASQRRDWEPISSSEHTDSTSSSSGSEDSEDTLHDFNMSNPICPLLTVELSALTSASTRLSVCRCPFTLAQQYHRGHALWERYTEQMLTWAERVGGWSRGILCCRLSRRTYVFSHQGHVCTHTLCRSCNRCKESGLQGEVRAVTVTDLPALWKCACAALHCIRYSNRCVTLSEQCH